MKVPHGERHDTNQERRSSEMRRGLVSFSIVAAVLLPATVALRVDDALRVVNQSYRFIQF